MAGALSALIEAGAGRVMQTMENRKTDPHDEIFQDELTEERNPGPAAREDAAHTARLDPEGDPDEARKLIKGEADRSVR